MPLHPNDIDDRKAAAVEIITSLVTELDRVPSQKEYATAVTNTDAPTLHQALYIFGTWTDAIIEAGLIPRDNKPPRSNDLTEKQVLDEFISVSNSLSRFPTQAEFTNNSQYSTRPYTRRWTNWTGVKQYFADNHADRLEFTPIVSKRKVQSPKRRPLAFTCAMQFEPRNEMETVVLFGLLATRLGYKIHTVRSDFPDAEVEKDGKLVLVEFEYLSSNYIHHGHDLQADCVCICWRKDRDIDPIPVIALEDVIRDWAR